MRFDYADLLDKENPGLLWVSRQGMVRHANACAASQTALSAGQSLYDPDLARAVDSVAKRGVPVEVTAMGSYCAGDRTFKELRCRVIPGTTPDDVFVIIGTVDTVQRPKAADPLLETMRSDLGDPLRRFQAALSRCQDQAVAHPIEALLGRLEELTFAMGKVLDMADLYGGKDTVGDASVSAWQLVQQAWSQEQGKAIERDVSARFHAHRADTLQVRVPGDPADLHRAMVECIDAAIASAQDGQTLDIEHRLDAGNLQIVFMDCQAFADADAAMPSPAFGSSGGPALSSGPRMPARQLIGYNFCRHVLSRHGGRLRVERHFGRRDLVIELPALGCSDVADLSRDHDPAQLRARNLSPRVAEAVDRSAKCGEGQPWSPECSAYSSSKISPTYAN